MVSVEDAMCGGHFFPSLLRKEKNKQPVVVCLTGGCRPYGDRSHREHDADNLWCDVRPWNTGRKTCGYCYLLPVGLSVFRTSTNRVRNRFVTTLAW